jgi:hypothetical protein
MGRLQCKTAAYSDYMLSGGAEPILRAVEKPEKERLL